MRRKVIDVKSQHRSGKNVAKSARVPGTDDEREAWKKTAALKHQQFAEFARKMLNAEAKKAGFDPEEKLDEQ